MEPHSVDTAVLIPDEPSSSPGAPLVVAVEASRMSRDVRGMGRYVRALLPRLVAQRPGLRLVLHLKDRRDVLAMTPAIDAMPAMRGRVELRTVRTMSRADAHVFWYPWNVASPAPATGPVVVTVHDVAPIAHPDPRLRGLHKNLGWRLRYAATARRATMIIADSQFTADEIHRLLGVPYERMRVVLLAADDFVAPPESGDSAILERLGVRRPFVLTVGAADRRKNLELLDRAMPAVLQSNPDAMLVLAGPRRRKASRDPAWRQTLGFISDGELAALYRQAAALVMPSTYEGFGLPVLEAMRMGTPVICVRASSLPEVGGDAAAWVDAEDDALLARTISSVLSDRAVRDRMRAASVAQEARFRWDETARQTIAVFEEAIAMTRR